MTDTDMLYMGALVKENDRLRALREQGHMTAVCYSWEQARELIEQYLKLPSEAVKGESESG